MGVYVFAIGEEREHLVFPPFQIPDGNLHITVGEQIKVGCRAKVGNKGQVAPIR